MAHPHRQLTNTYISGINHMGYTGQRSWVVKFVSD